MMNGDLNLAWHPGAYWIRKIHGRGKSIVSVAIVTITNCIPQQADQVMMKYECVGSQVHG